MVENMKFIALAAALATAVWAVALMTVPQCTATGSILRAGQIQQQCAGEVTAES